jgi:hypothetical protein
MMTIYKFPIEGRETEIPIPRNAQILTADFQGSQLCVWVLLDPELACSPCIIEVLMTGEQWDGPGRLTYIATRQRNGIVVHVFMRGDL